MQPAGLPGRKLTMGPPQPDTPTQPRRDPSPPPGLPARGHPRQGRLRRRPAGGADARSLTRASRAHEHPAARERDTRGQFTMPANHSADAKLQAEPPLTPARSFRDVPGNSSLTDTPVPGGGGHQAGRGAGEDAAEHGKSRQAGLLVPKHQDAGPMPRRIQRMQIAASIAVGHVTLGILCRSSSQAVKA